jgi:uncharacterized RDD family membrane protein YckC
MPDASAATPTTPAPAGIWRRVAAFLLDLVVLLPLLAILSWVWAGLFDIALPSEKLPLYDYLVQLYLQDDPLVLGGLLLLSTLLGVYFLIGHLLWAGTAGMWVLDLTVVESTGRPVGAGASAARVFGAGLSAAYFLLGFVWIAFDARRQGLHDKIADTLVVRRKAR